MSRVYSLGSASSEGDTKALAAKMVEMMKTIPMIKHKHPEIPTDYTARQMNLPPESQEALLKTEEDSDLPAALRYCRSCFSISRDLSLFMHARDLTPQETKEYIHWKAYFQKVADAAERKCPFYSFIACRFFNDRGILRVWSTGLEQPKSPLGCCTLDEGDIPKVKEAIDKLKEYEQQRPGGCIGLIAQPVDYSLVTQSFTKLRFLAASSNVGDEMVNKILGYRRDLVLEIYQHPAGDTRDCFPLKMPENLDPGGEPTFDWAKRCLQRCISTHAACPKPLDRSLPTIVLKIVDEKSLALVSEKYGHYISLSYCWGGPQPFATTKETLLTMQQGFATTSLPQTIQDAVKVARKLGVQYLWVDSLCIIQDSEEDKLNELPRMASYYENALVTVVAGGATCTDSILSRKEACEKHAGAVAFSNMLARPVLCPKGHSHVCLFREATPYEISKEPVHKRAWTFQERLLSPRMLMYGQRVSWHCQTMQFSEGGCDDWTEEQWNQGQRRIQKILGQGQTPSAGGNDTSDDIVTGRSVYHDVWYDVVREFSRRAITFQDDKLPAISALASKFQSLNNDVYLAGVWRGDLLRDLLWSTYPTVTLSKPPTWRAPSWSWTSVNNPITYRRLPNSSAIALTEVVSYSITPKHVGAPFGEIKEATLELCGPIMTPEQAFTKSIMKQDNIVTHDDAAMVYEEMTIFNEDHTNSGFVNWEAPEKHILLLLYATMRNEADWDDEKGVATVAGLALAQIEEDMYERIGCFTTMGSQGVKYWMNHVSKRSIKLI